MPALAPGPPMDPKPSSGPVLPLRLEDLSVVYGERKAVDRLNLEVRPGEIYGLLGSNGAGKSSTIKSIVGLVRPAGGTVRVFGYDAQKESIATKERIGYVPETSMLYESLTPHEFLEFVSGVRRLDPARAAARARDLVAAFRLTDEFDEPISSLSNGTRQKVLVVAALLHQPPLLVLDEPLNHLDPRSLRLMKDLLTQYSEEPDAGDPVLDPRDGDRRAAVPPSGDPRPRGTAGRGNARVPPRARCRGGCEPRGDLPPPHAGGRGRPGRAGVAREDVACPGARPFG